jgi:hypothetical protein
MAQIRKDHVQKKSPIQPPRNRDDPDEHRRREESSKTQYEEDKRRGVGVKRARRKRSEPTQS